MSVAGTITEEVDEVNRSLVIIVAVTALAGCLFPPFDDMQGGAPEAAPPSDGGSPRKDSEPDGGAAAEGEAPSPPTTEPDAGGAKKLEIACGGEQCDGTVRHCCFTDVSGATCSLHKDEGLCTGLGPGGTVVLCDGPEDCAGGNVCCYSGNKASCRPSCAGGEVLCHAGSPGDCKGAGQQCTGSTTIGGPVKVTYGVCQ